MNYFIEGIKIFAPTIDLEQRIEISNGVASLSNIQDIEYSNRAFAPQKKWRKPTRNDIAILASDKGKEDYSQLVSIVSFYREPKTYEIKRLYEDAIKDKITFEDYKQEVLKIIHSDNIKKQLYSIEEPIVAGLAIHKKGLRTVTINKKTGKYVGLHLDSWDSKPILERHLSSNRVCINLSEESRYLLFINLPIKTIAKLTNSAADNIPDLVCEKFMQDFNEYPVVKLELKPFEAYVAPTENMIHDATTESMRSDSFSFTFRGFFKINTPSV